MKEKDFNKLKPELRKAYLERGGTIEPNKRIKSVSYSKSYKKSTKYKKSNGICKTCRSPFYKKNKGHFYCKAKCRPSQSKSNKESRVKKFLKLKELAIRLNKDLPKSEKWFHSLWEPHKHKKDHYNHTFNGVYIPDIINKQHRYIIEVDGTIHDKPTQKIKDLEKDIYYMRHGYFIFRIRAYDIDAFTPLLDQITKLREKMSSFDNIDNKRTRKRKKRKYAQACNRCKIKAALSKLGSSSNGEKDKLPKMIKSL